MIRKLLHGFIFGLGFSLAVVLVTWGIGMFNMHSSRGIGLSSLESDDATYAEQAKWRELSAETRLEQLSGVALLRFKAEENKLMAAYVDRIIAKSGGIRIPLAVGDRVKSSDYYAQDDIGSNRDGILLMYAGDPPKIMESAYLYDSRLAAYGDMPLDVFFNKFGKAKGK